MDKPAIPEVKINDRCPAWASAVIARIRDIEIEAGNVTPAGDWQQLDLGKLQGRLFTKEEGPDDSENLFSELSRRLVSEGFSPADIAAFVNARIVSSGRLPYCSAAEVSEALG